MKKGLLTLLLLIGSFSGRLLAQDTSSGPVRFVSGLSWNEVKAKAKAEKKLIFVDCFTTWCGFCKEMSEKVFPLPLVGKFINTHFIPVDLQMDQTKADSPEVRSWYEEAKRIEGDYQVYGYPTYLIFDADGQLVYRFEGYYEDPTRYIVTLAEALDPATQPYTKFTREVGVYTKDENFRRLHVKDSAYLLHAISLARVTQHDGLADSLAATYMDGISDPWSETNFKLGYQTMRTIKAKTFRLTLQDPDRAAAVLTIKRQRVIDRIKDIIIVDELFKVLYDDKEQPVVPVDWKPLIVQINREYPQLADRIVCEAQYNYYKKAKMWPEYQKAVWHFMRNYGGVIGEPYVKNRCWDIFLHCPNEQLLKEAVKWMEPYMATFPNAPLDYVTTYANLLYKTGDKTNAILWEKKVISLLEDEKYAKDRKGFEATVAKMEKGEKTWED